MARVIKIVKGIRTHWKKSIFAAGSVAYGVSYAKERYDINQSMRALCLEASKYGDVGQPIQARSRNILVLVNPVADRRSSFENFEEYCAPILHLAGLSLEIVKTDSEGHARRYIEDLKQLPDAIVVAGGDGTICEAITGLLRRSEYNTCPIGVIPTGRTNTLASKLFGPSKLSKLKDVENIANAALSVVRGRVESKDIMKIEIIHADDDETPRSKPIYAIGSVHWGAFRDALNLRDKYWYFGPLRNYVTFLFNAFDNDLSWHCNSKLIYTDPCQGCSNCFVKRQMNRVEHKRWWSMFVPKFGRGGPRTPNEPDYSKVKNENCSTLHDIESKSIELLIENHPNSAADNAAPKISVQFGPENSGGFDFISNSWNRVRTHQVEFERFIDARSMELIPNVVSTEEKEIFFSIDNEAFEVKPIRINVVPKAVQIFTL